ncbi:MAG TPA: hypothetical protein VFX45_09235 [Solirubrobacterales bacterium]|nr:hypothetical protein [Solirubrobacterales bacterium]
MRFIKLLGIAAVAAIAAMAFVGAGSASAMTLCKENASFCPEGQRYKKGDVIKFHTNKAVIKTSTMTLTCSADLQAKLNEETGEPQKTETIWSFGKCEGSCSTLTAVGMPSTGLNYSAILWGFIWLSHQLESGTPGVIASSCSFESKECAFQVVENEEKPASAVFKLEEGSPSTVYTGGEKGSVVKFALVSGNSFLCGSTATWEGTYAQTLPEKTGIWGAEP